MEIYSLRSLAPQKSKTENNMNPYYMKETFSKTTNLTYRPLDINFNQNNTTNFRARICVVKSKRKSSMKNLRIIGTTGLIRNANVTCATF